MAQPPLSRQIQQLEAELGVRLFLRDRRKVQLTDAGRVLAAEARALLNQAARASEVVRLAGKGKYGLVRVGIGSGLGTKVHRVLLEHAKRFPQVEVACQDVLSSLQNEALRERQIDVGFLRPPVDRSRLESEFLFEEQFLVFLSKRSPLARKKKLKLQQLANETLLLFDRNLSMGVYDKTLELYREAGISPRILFSPTAPYEEAGALLVAGGKGIYLGVGAIRREASGRMDIAAIPLDEPRAKVEVHVAWRRAETSGAVLEFLNSVRRVFGRASSSSPALRTLDQFGAR